MKRDLVKTVPRAAVVVVDSVPVAVVAEELAVVEIEVEIVAAGAKAVVVADMVEIAAVAAEGGRPCSLQ